MGELDVWGTEFSREMRRDATAKPLTAEVSVVVRAEYAGGLFWRPSGAPFARTRIPLMELTSLEDC